MSIILPDPRATSSLKAFKASPYYILRPFAKEDGIGLGASGGVPDLFVVDPTKALTDGMVCFVHASMNKFDTYFLD